MGHTIESSSSKNLESFKIKSSTPSDPSSVSFTISCKVLKSQPVLSKTSFSKCWTSINCSPDSLKMSSNSSSRITRNSKLVSWQRLKQTMKDFNINALMKTISIKALLFCNIVLFVYASKRAMEEYLKNNERSRLLFWLNKSCLTSFTTIPSIREVSWEQYYRQLNILLRSFSTKTLRISNFVNCNATLKKLLSRALSRYASSGIKL